MRTGNSAADAGGSRHTSDGKSNGSLNQLWTVAALILWSVATTGIAQQKPEPLEPLPTDPEKRVYYGEYYSPEEYAKCWEKWVKTNDPKAFLCDKYKERLEPLDPARRELFGEFYDPKKYHECRRRVEQQDVQCEYLKLRRREARGHWPYPNVPALKLPGAPDPPVYRWWMNARQYFDALCKSEAGEFIYRTVDNVEGVYRIRARRMAGTAALRDRYVMEDPYGYTEAEARTVATVFHGPKKYRYFEAALTSWLNPEVLRTFIRYFGYDDRDRKTLRHEYVSKLKSQYGYTWRGIKRPKDREHGIAGGELIVINLASNEVLAVRRGFMLAGTSRYSRSALTWEYGQFCPLLSTRTGIAKDYDASYEFVARVLRPAK